MILQAKIGPTSHAAKCVNLTLLKNMFFNVRRHIVVPIVYKTIKPLGVCFASRRQYITKRKDESDKL